MAIGAAGVGLDVERIDSAQDIDGVAGMSLAPEELQELNNAESFALYHYVAVRDLAEAFRLAIERPMPRFNTPSSHARSRSFRN